MNCMKRIINNLDLAKAGSFLYKGWKNAIFGVKKGWKDANFRAEIGWKNARRLQYYFEFIKNPIK